MKRKEFCLKPANVIKKFVIPVAAILILMTLFGCQSESDEVPAEKIAKVYVDLLVAKELYRSNPDTVSILEKEIFSKYNIDKDYYEKSIKNFKDDKEKWDLFFNVAKSYLDSLHGELMKTDTTKGKKQN